MTDVKLAAAFLCALPSNARMIFVGDHNQLPSVGPGAVLRDMIKADVPHIILNKVKRSDEAGSIVKACHAIKDGKVPRPPQTFDWQRGDNWRHIECNSMDGIAEHIANLFRTARDAKRDNPDHPFWSNRDPFWDMQVVTPQNDKLPIACDAMNETLAGIMNPIGDIQGDDPHGTRKPDFRVGDKVVRKKNAWAQAVIDHPLTDHSALVTDDYGEVQSTGMVAWQGQHRETGKCRIVNGDIGHVKDIFKTHDDKTYVVVHFTFPNRLCVIGYGVAKLKRAYAITCHSAQGSGFPYVIVPMHRRFYWNPRTGDGLFHREWVYTGFSRAEKILTTVGEWSAFVAACGRKTADRRHTQLARLISDTRRVGQDTGLSEEVIPFPFPASTREDDELDYDAMIADNIRKGEW